MSVPLHAPQRPRHRTGAPDGELFAALGSADETARERACEELVRRYEWLARWAANRYAGRGESPEELRQVACLGLMLAIRRFEPDRAVDFPAFARPTVLGEVKKHFRDRRRWIRLPRRLQELKPRIRDAASTLAQELGREPTDAEVADRLGVAVGDVREAAAAADTFVLTSLDAPLADDGGPGVTHLDLLAVLDPHLERLVDVTAVQALLAKLPPRELRMVLLRFYGNQTQAQIAAAIGVSQMQVSRLLDSTMANLRSALCT